MQDRRFTALLLTIVLALMAFAAPTLLVTGCAAPKSLTPDVVQPPPPPPGHQAWNPLIASDPDGRLYITFYSGPGGHQRGLSFTRSLDRGTTWLADPIVLEPVTRSGTRIGFHRLERDGRGNVYVTWSLEVPVEMGKWRTREIRRRRSSDYGATWTLPATIWRSGGKQLFPTARTGIDGELSLVWTQDQGGAEDLFYSRTVQGGLAWWPKPIRVNTAKDADTGPARRGKLARQAAWPFLTSDERGQLFLAWDENRNGVLPDIFFSRSVDGGVTWLEGGIRLNTAPSGKWTARTPFLATDNKGGVYAIWGDSRHKAEDIYFNRSLDHGATWLNEDIRLTPQRSSDFGATTLGPLLYADREGRLYVHWREGWEAPGSIFFTRSLDRGATWLLRPRRLDHHGPEAVSNGARLAYDEAGHLSVTWLHTEGKNSTILFNRSDDFGDTWLPRPMRLDSDPDTKDVARKQGPRLPRITADGLGTAYVVWSNDRDGKYGIYLNRSTNHGVTWLQREIRVTR